MTGDFTPLVAGLIGVGAAIAGPPLWFGLAWLWRRVPVLAALPTTTGPDRRALGRNPGNGWRAHRLIMKASTEVRVEMLFQDFMSQPHKVREPLVFAAYWLKKSHLAGVSLQDCWMQMSKAAVEYEKATGNVGFWEKVIPEAGQLQQKLWPD